MNAKEHKMNAKEQKTRKSRKLPKAIRPEEFVKLIKTIPKKEKILRVACLLAYGAGMRNSEVLRCSKEHFRGNSIFVPESKYGVERMVPVPKGWKTEFFNLLPLKMSIRTFQNRIKKYVLLSKLNPGYTPHSLRHGFATRMIESGVPMNQVQVLMGHSNLSTTSIYVRANPLDAIKSYEDLF